MSSAQGSTIDEASIRRMVHEFYAKARTDAALGPIFESRLSGRWSEHLEKMVDFWATALLHERRYVGNPRATHAMLADVRGTHFERWLELFDETLHDIFADDVAEVIGRRAQMMARGLMSAMPQTIDGSVVGRG
jgi:hemoglobin